MIGKLKGIVDSYGEDYVILDVGGVGYQVHCSARTMHALPSSGEAATLSIETHVREDQIKLFGFTSDIEREWFRLLQTVQGVGAKVAMSVLGTLKSPTTTMSSASAGTSVAWRRSRAARRWPLDCPGSGWPRGPAVTSSTRCSPANPTPSARSGSPVT